MEKKCYSNLFLKFISFVTSGLLFFILSTSANAEWHSGIGTGLSSQYRYGTIGFRTVLFGDVKMDYELDSQALKDHLNSSFEFAGNLSDGRWMIQYSLASLELEDNAKGRRLNGSEVTGDITLKTTSAEMTVGHPVLKFDNLVLRAHTGLRYIKHDFESDLTNLTTTIERDFDHEWTDLLLGVTMNIPITNQLTWNNKMNIGFGGSEGTFFGSVGATWRFHKNFSTGLTAKVMSVEFENDSKGDSDWYLYDVDESSLTLDLLFHW